MHASFGLHGPPHVGRQDSALREVASQLLSSFGGNITLIDRLAELLMQGLKGKLVVHGSVWLQGPFRKLISATLDIELLDAPSFLHVLVDAGSLRTQFFLGCDHVFSHGTHQLRETHLVLHPRVRARELSDLVGLCLVGHAYRRLHGANGPCCSQIHLRPPYLGDAITVRNTVDLRLQMASDVMLLSALLRPQLPGAFGYLHFGLPLALGAAMLPLPVLQIHAALTDELLTADSGARGQWLSHTGPL